MRGDELGNVERARQFEFNRQLAKIGKPVDRGEWDMTPPTVNAYYNPTDERHQFPRGRAAASGVSIPTSDAAPNYGDTGGTIGHELTHGFDDEGRQFDAEGNLRDWWTPQDGKEFEKRAACISNQYSSYTIIDDIKINGKLTLGEDVADLGGLLLAYMAWKAGHKSSEAASQSTALHRSNGSLSDTDRAGAARPATKPSACARPSIRIRRKNIAPTESSPTCRNSRRPFTARQDRRWSMQTAAVW